MHGYDRIELLQISVGNRGKLRAAPGVVHQAIEAAKAVHGMVNHILDISFDGDVRAYEARGLAEFLRESLASILASAGNHDLGVIGGEHLGSASADAAGPAGYNRDFLFEKQHGNALPDCWAASTSAAVDPSHWLIELIHRF